MLHENPAVEKVARPLTVQLSASQVVLCVDMQFKPELGAAEIAGAIDELETQIQRHHPAVCPIFIEADRLKECSQSNPAK